jgi:hypothetical protein
MNSRMNKKIANFVAEPEAVIADSPICTGSDSLHNTEYHRVHVEKVFEDLLERRFKCV